MGAPLQAAFVAHDDPAWQAAPRVLLAALDTAERSSQPACVGVTTAGGRRALLELPDDAGSSTFKDLRVRDTQVFVGHGREVHVLRASDWSFDTHPMPGYFSSLVVPEDLGLPPGSFGVLAAGCTDLLHFADQGQLRWRARDLAFDGVIVHNVHDGLIQLSVEMDPPGGWQDARLALATGLPVQ